MDGAGWLRGSTDMPEEARRHASLQANFGYTIVGRSPHAHGCSSSASDRLMLFLSLAVDCYALDFLSPKSELTNGGVRPHCVEVGLQVHAPTLHWCSPRSHSQ